MGFTADRSAESLLPSEERLDTAFRAITHAVGERLRELVAEYTPVSDDPFREFPGRLPGTLRRSWELGDVDVRGTRYTVVVETHDPVAPHVEWDTAPHRIKPRPDRVARAAAEGRRAMLSWRDSRTGLQVFAHEVLHPGTSGAHMMARALDRLELEWPVIVEREMTRLGI